MQLRSANILRFLFRNLAVLRFVDRASTPERQSSSGTRISWSSSISSRGYPGRQPQAALGGVRGC